MGPTKTYLLVNWTNDIKLSKEKTSAVFVDFDKPQKFSLLISVHTKIVSSYSRRSMPINMSRPNKPQKFSPLSFMLHNWLAITGTKHVEL